MKGKDRYLALWIAFLLIFSVFSVVAPATGRSNQVRFNFSFANKWGTYQATAYYVEGTKNAPVVLFLHGLDANKNWYKWMIEPYVRADYVLVMFNIPSKWAMQGFLSNQPEFGPYVDGFSACIDSLSDLKRLSGVINLDFVAATGHSAGGLGAMAAGAQDSRIRAIVALTPPIHVSILPHPTIFSIPVQLQVGSNEGELYDGVVKYYDQELQAPVKQLVVIQGGNHIQFMDAGIVALIKFLARNGYDIPYVGNQPSGISTEKAHDTSSKAILSFLNENLDA